MTLQNMDYIVDKFPNRVTRDVKLFLSKNHTKHNNTKINNLSFKNCKSSHITNIKDIINNQNTDFKHISVYFSLLYDKINIVKCSSILVTLLNLDISS